MDAASQEDILNLVSLLQSITDNCQALMLRQYRVEVYDYMKGIGFDDVTDDKIGLLNGPVVRYLTEHHTSHEMSSLYPCCLLLFYQVKFERNKLPSPIEQLTHLLESDTVALGYIDAIEAALGRFMDMFLLSPIIFSLTTDLREARSDLKEAHRQHKQKQTECQVLERDLLNTTAELKTTQLTLKNTENELANANELLGDHKDWLISEAHIPLNFLLTQLSTI